MPAVLFLGTAVGDWESALNLLVCGGRITLVVEIEGRPTLSNCVTWALHAGVPEERLAKLRQKRVRPL